MARRWYATDRHVIPPSMQVVFNETVITTFDAVEDALSATVRLIDRADFAETTVQPTVSFSTGTDIATVKIDAEALGLERDHVYELQLTLVYPDEEERTRLKVVECVA